MEKKLSKPTTPSFLKMGPKLSLQPPQSLEAIEKSFTFSNRKEKKSSNLEIMNIPEEKKNKRRPSTAKENIFKLKKSLNIFPSLKSPRSQISQKSQTEVFRNDQLSENILVTLPSQISINKNKFIEEKLSKFGPCKLENKQIHRHKGDHQSIIFSQNYSKLSKFWNRSEKSDPITKLLKGGFNQIK